MLRKLLRSFFSRSENDQVRMAQVVRHSFVAGVGLVPTTVATGLPHECEYFIARETASGRGSNLHLTR